MPRAGRPRSPGRIARDARASRGDRRRYGSERSRGAGPCRERSTRGEPRPAPPIRPSADRARRHRCNRASLPRQPRPIQAAGDRHPARSRSSARASSRPSGLRLQTPIRNTCVKPRAARLSHSRAGTVSSAKRFSRTDNRSSHGHALISNRCGWFVSAASFQPPVVSLAGSWKLVAGSG